MTSHSETHPVHVPRARLIGVQIFAYKALSGFDFVLPQEGPLIFIGANGTGKSSVLQAMSFLRYFAEGNTLRFFDERDWRPEDVGSQFGMVGGALDVSDDIMFNYVFDIEGKPYAWLFAYNTTRKKTLMEFISPLGELNEEMCLLRFHLGVGSIRHIGMSMSGIAPDGSLLSLADLSSGSDTPSSRILFAMKNFAQGIVSLELLSPSGMRQMGRGEAKDMGVRGEMIGSFLASLPLEKRARIADRLARFYPPLQQLVARKARAGWIDFRIREIFGERSVTVGPRHVSDGVLRLLALAALPELPSTTSLVLIDEAEDGIDPLILPSFIEAIAADSSAQILLTTHSPLLANRFAPSSLFFLARSEEGPTIGAHFSEISGIADELEYRGPGEIWLHSDLGVFSKWVREAHHNRRKGGSDIWKGAREFCTTLNK